MKNDRDRQAASLGGAVIVYEDADMLVVDKPPGMVSAQVGDATGRTLFHYVKTYVRHRGPTGRPQAAWVIHRLDREVSGLLVFAKTHSAFLGLKDQLKRRQVSRQYIAVVEGEMPLTPDDAPWQFVSNFVTDCGPGRPVRTSETPPPAGRSLEGREPLRPRAGGRSRPETEETPRAMRAVTYYRVLATGRGRSLLAVRIETGRKHQIRAHLAGLGRPVVGDALYQGRARGPHTGPGRQERIALHAYELGLTHPRTGQSMRWRVSPGREFLDLVGASEDALEKMMPATAALKTAEAASVSKSTAAAPPAATRGAAEKAVGPAARPEQRADARTEQREEKRSAAQDAGWEHVAPWYETMLEKGRSDHHEELVMPGVLRLLELHARQRVLDVACGEGSLARRLQGAGVTYLGVDASEHMVETARRRAAHVPGSVRPMFVVGDARRLLDVPELADKRGAFDAAACVLALMNMDPLEAVLSGTAELLKEGGRLVAVVLHPAFRAPGQTSWEWEGRGSERQQAEGGRENPRDAARGRLGGRDATRGRLGGRRDDSTRGRAMRRGIALGAKQYRRVDAYLSVLPREIVMNPGEVAHGKPAITTMTYHRPLQAYVKAFAEAGLLIDALEEWASQRTSQPGPRAAEEDRARREIPMFLAIRGIKRE